MSAYLSTSQVAERLAVDAGKVLAWIHSKQLPAVDVSENPGGKPRWRISEEALEEFLRRRESRPAAASPRRKRSADVIEFIK